MEKPKSGREIRDVDSAALAFRIKAFAWSLAGGLVGGLMAVRAGLNPFVGFVLGTAATFGVTTGIVALSGRAASTLYAPSGRSTPPKRGYSHPESLEVRERYGEALEAYREMYEEDPSDPELHFRIARLHRDRLGDPEAAIDWLRRARDLEEIPPGMAIHAGREIVETYVHHLEEPRRALPELARMADEHRGSPAGDRARKELRELKERLMGSEDE